MLLQLPSGIFGFLLMVFLSVVSPGSFLAWGFVVLYRPRYSLLNSWTDSCGRFVLTEFQDRNVIFRVACVYAPKRKPDRITIFRFVSSKIDPSFATLVCGDFNTVFDRRGSSVLDSSRESTASLLSLFRDCGVIDI